MRQQIWGILSPVKLGYVGQKEKSPAFRDFPFTVQTPGGGVGGGRGGIHFFPLQLRGGGLTRGWAGVIATWWSWRCVGVPPALAMAGKLTYLNLEEMTITLRAAVMPVEWESEWH